jgi:hypothetical protein
VSTVEPSSPQGAGDPRAAAIERIKAKRRVWTTGATLLVVEAGLIAIWALTTPNGHFWPIWPAIGFVFAFGSQAWSVYGGRAISEEQIQREMDKGA